MRRIVLLFSFFIFGFILSACTTDADDERLSVVATTTFIGDMVEQIAGDRIDLFVMMGPGIDPHDYLPTARDTQRLQNADLIVINGLNLEERMGQVLASLNDEAVLVLGDYLNETDLLFEDDDDAFDPHMWFDLSLWSTLVPVVAERLSALDPQNSSIYQARATQYVLDLLDTHELFLSRVQAIEPDQRILITAHDAFAYLGRAYGFEVYAIQGISTEGQASINDIRDLAALMKEKQVTKVFFESTLPEETIQALVEAAQAIGHQASVGGVLFSDSTGSFGEGLDTLTRAMRHNMNTILSALGD